MVIGSGAALDNGAMFTVGRPLPGRLTWILGMLLDVELVSPRTGDNQH